MTHLTNAELVDWIESSPELPAARLQHAVRCAECRAEADALRSVLALAATDDVPPPSPLFWDHFSSRVAEAVRGKAPVAESTAGIGWLRRPFARWATAGTMAALVILVLVWRGTVYAPVGVIVTVPSTAAPADGANAQSTAPAVAEPDNADDDEAWAIVRAAAADLRWDEAHAAGLSARPAAIEGLALELTAAERSELARLVDEELKRNGV
jgi:hypothetical protein